MNFCIFSFVEKINDSTTMTLDDNDIFVSQSYGDDKNRTLRLTKQNVKALTEVWRNLVRAYFNAQRDKVVSEDFPLGDRLHVTCSTDYPVISFRRWKKPNFLGEVYPTEHGFTLRHADFTVFEKNVDFFLQAF